MQKKSRNVLEICTIFFFLFCALLVQVLGCSVLKLKITRYQRLNQLMITITNNKFFFSPIKYFKQKNFRHIKKNMFQNNLNSFPFCSPHLRKNKHNVKIVQKKKSSKRLLLGSTVASLQQSRSSPGSDGEYART